MYIYILYIIYINLLLYNQPYRGRMKHDETILPTSHPKTRRTWHHLLTEATQVPSKPLASEASRGELPGLGSRSVSAEYLPYINLYIYIYGNVLMDKQFIYMYIQMEIF